MPSKFETSQEPAGAHYFLAQLAGQWAGTSRTWFEPDKLGDEAPISGTIRLVLDGRFALHEYASRMQGAPLAGLALHGYDLAEGRFLTAWADSFHNGTTIMFSQGEPGAWPGACSALGSYPDGQGGPRWGWRTAIEQPAPDRLLIVHFNVTPDGDESKAVEWDYQRAG